MGSLRQRELLPSSVPDDTDSAHEVGAVPKQQSFTACRIGAGPDGDMIFLGEVEILVAWDVKEEQLQDGKLCRWWRYEGKVDPKREGCDIRPGQDLIVAEHPYSIERIHNAAFKLGSRKGHDERPSLSRRCASAEALLKEVEALSVDYWERGSLLTAGLSNPEMSCRPDGAGRRYQKDSLYVLGICQDFDSTVQQLHDSSQARELLRLTAERRIRFWRSKVSRSLRLYDEVAEQGPTLLLVSIRQALAGPHRHGERWKYKPVMLLVDYIYRGHLNSYNRKVHRRSETTFERGLDR